MARRLRRSRIQCAPAHSADEHAVARQAETHEEQQVRRARRFKRRGEHRQAMLALREACQISRQCPRLWTLYAVACVRVRRVDDAKQALRQALWLRQRAHDAGRVKVTLKLIEQLEERDAGLPLRAA